MTRDLPIRFSQAAIAKRVETLAQEIAPAMEEDAAFIVLLQGAMPFAVDLLRALAAIGRHPMLDCLWLESYRDARVSSGKVMVRADLSRSVHGRSAWLIDDVFDTGATLAYARQHVLAKGASATMACALVRKPAAQAEPIEHVGFEAGDEFLVGYGMDDRGYLRGLPYIAALP